MTRSKKFDAGSYGGKGGGHGKKGRPLGGVIREKSLGAIRQEYGEPYFPSAPRGFRPNDAGKVVRDPNNRTAGPLDSMTPRGDGDPHG